MGAAKRRWSNVRKRWITQHPPDFHPTIEGLGWTCTFCGGWIPEDKLSLDHILRVEDYPQFKYVQWNLRPMHGPCNSKLDTLIVHENKRKGFLKNGRRKGRVDHPTRQHMIRCLEETLATYERYSYLPMAGVRGRNNTTKYDVAKPEPAVLQ